MAYTSKADKNKEHDTEAKQIVTKAKESVMSRMMKAGSIKMASVLTNSPMFVDKDFITTDLPILNIAFSGEYDGGMVPGLTIIAGESKSFKTLLTLYCMKSYMDLYKDSVGIIYDAEFGITPSYLTSIGIDTDRVIHIPIEHIEQLKFDMVKRLEEVQRGDKVFFMIDSLGVISSKKEIDDALDEKSVADMTRAKSLRSLLRIITPHLTIKDIPCVAINHVYKEMALYPKTIVGGGTAIQYASNTIFIITKAQEKDGDDLVGYNFTINIEKSRFVIEKTKLPFTVTFEGGVQKYSGLFELAKDAGHIITSKVGWYQRVIPDSKTGEIKEDKLWRLKECKTDEFWEPILTHTTFKNDIKKRFKLSSSAFQNNTGVNEDA